MSYETTFTLSYPYLSPWTGSNGGDDEGTSGVREPRRPLPTLDSGEVSLVPA